jgi:hypothetical protein
MPVNANPSIDPANENTLAGILQFAFGKFLNNVDGMLPAKVVAYDRTKNRVQVQLLIALVATDGTNISRAQIASLPVLVLGGGGFLINFNLNPGDLGWVIANDRDISAFLQSYSESAPNTVRKHSFSDGLFIPDVMTNYTIASEDSSNMVIQNSDGSVKISLGSEKIKIAAPTIELSGDVIIDDMLTVNGLLVLNGGITSTGGSGPNNATFTGNVRVVGDITASGDITPHVP